MKYTAYFNRSKTPQSRRIPRTSQVPNSAGGYAWAVDRWTLVERFLILGSENGTYYIGEQKLTMDHARNLVAAIQADGERVVSMIVSVSVDGRAPKNDPAIFALALASATGDEKTRAAALLALPLVCRTGAHLLAFAAVSDGMRGWGRGLRKAVGRWYNAKAAEALEYQMFKYKQREGWSQRDLLRLAHPVPASEEHKTLYKWIVDEEVGEGLRLVKASRELRNLSVKEAAAKIREEKIPREAIPTELLNEALVWDALLDAMPMTAMVRNLGNLSKCGLLTAGSEAEAKVVAELGNVERVKNARVHPVAFLSALSTYASGRGLKGDGTWTPSAAVVDALDLAFYSAFANVKPTGKRLVLGIDVSGSMAGTHVAGLASLECRQAAGAMALVTLATERNAQVMAFDTSSYPLTLSARQRLDDVVGILAKTGGGGTDCSLPIQYAIDRKIETDAIVIYTDSETWAGRMHPSQAMEQYRAKMRIPSKLIVVAMASNRFSVGDAADPRTLNVAGFDTTVPDVIAEFLRK